MAGRPDRWPEGRRCGRKARGKARMLGGWLEANYRERPEGQEVVEGSAEGAEGLPDR